MDSMPKNTGIRSSIWLQVDWNYPQNVKEIQKKNQLNEFNRSLGNGGSEYEAIYVAMFYQEMMEQWFNLSNVPMKNTAEDKHRKGSNLDMRIFDRVNKREIVLEIKVFNSYDKEGRLYIEGEKRGVSIDLK